MDSMTLFIASLAVSCIGALASVLLIKADNAAKTAGCLIGAVAAVLSFVAGIQAVLGDVTSVDTIVFFPFARFQLLLNQLSGLFVALISVLAFAGFDLRSSTTLMSTRARRAAPASSLTPSWRP